ncbi:MAG: winged helix-turn-helix domain-containing protein [Nanoarchaeota archaeon]
MMERAYDIFFETIGNRNRMLILQFLDKNPMIVSEISKALKLDQTTVSHNLKRLNITGFVNFKKKGKNRIYYINSKIVRPLLNLAEDHMKCNCKKLCKCNKKELMEKLRR